MKQNHQFRERGFTLIEVLVALLVVTIGLIGMAGIQAAAVKYTKGAEGRNHAVQLSYDMLDRMRASQPSLQTGTYTSASSFVTVACVRNFVSANAVQDQADIAVWRNQIACLLPAGQGRIEVGAPNAFGAFPVTISVRWSEDRITGGLGSYDYIARAQL